MHFASPSSHSERRCGVTANNRSGTLFLTLSRLCQDPPKILPHLFRTRMLPLRRSAARTRSHFKIALSYFSSTIFFGVCSGTQTVPLHSAVPKNGHARTEDDIISVEHEFFAFCVAWACRQRRACPILPICPCSPTHPHAERRAEKTELLAIIG